MQGGENISTAFVLSGPLPLISNGTTEGFLDDYDEECPYSGSNAPDVVYAFTPSAAVTVNIDLCGSSYDTKVFIYENAATPGNPFDCNDDFDAGNPCGPYISKIENAFLSAGNTYYIVIDGYSTTDYGEYVLTISEVVSCSWGVEVACPGIAVPENEDCGDNTNGGCDMAPGNENRVTVPSSGETFCGTNWTNGTARDTDWFELVLTQASTVTLSADADRQILYGMVESTSPGSPACDAITGNITPANNAGPCDETSLALGILAPGTYWFKVEMTGAENLPCENHYWINFDVFPELCSPPADLAAANITTTSAELSWFETGTATAWEYQLGPTGFTPAANGTPTATIPVMVNSLSANTAYDFYARAVCGEGNYSDWSGPQNFRTPCEPLNTIPWSENFDAMVTIGNDILPTCWESESFTGTPWATGNSSSNTYNDPCSAPNYVYVDYSPYPADKFLITPGFSLMAGTSYDFRFKWAGDGYAGWNGDVMVNTFQTGAGAVVLGSPFVDAGTVTAAICTSVKRSFVPAVNGTYYFMVRISNNFAPLFLGFDDFEVVLSPLCTEPIGLTADNITTTTANLSWSPSGLETAWEYVYGEAPLAAPPGSGTTTSSSTVNPIAGLTANTEYQYYARAACEPGFSVWAGPFGFKTLCEPVSVFPYTESFESAWPPACWTDPETAEYGWDQSTFGTAHTGTEWAYCNRAGSELFTPVFTIAPDAWLIFWYRVEHQDDPQDMSVKAGNDVIFQITEATNTDYLEVRISLAAYTGQNISVSFTGETGTGGVDNGIFLDDVLVKLANSWTGNVSTAWNNNGNWSSGAIPDLNDVVVIPSVPIGGNFPVIANGITGECSSFSLSPGASLIIETGGTLHTVNP